MHSTSNSAITRSPSFATGGGAAASSFSALTIDKTNPQTLENQLPKVIVNSNQALHVAPASSRKWPGVCVLTGLVACGVSFLNEASLGKSIGIGLVAGTTLFSLVKVSQKHLNPTAQKPVKTPSETIVLPPLNDEMPEVRIPIGLGSNEGNAAPRPHKTTMDDGSEVWLYREQDLEEYNSNQGYAILTGETKPSFDALTRTHPTTVAGMTVYFNNLYIYTKYLPVSFDTNQTFTSGLEAQNAFLGAIKQREHLVQTALSRSPGK
jgi:hypothetical protein